MVNESKYTHTLQFNEIIKHFEDTKEINTVNLIDNTYRRFNEWIANFLKGMSFVYNGYVKNSDVPYTPFYIYGIKLKTCNKENDNIHEYNIIFPKPLTEFHTYIEKSSFYNNSKIFLDVYVTFNKKKDTGKIVHLLFDKDVPN